LGGNLNDTDGVTHKRTDELTNGPKDEEVQKPNRTYQAFYRVDWVFRRLGGVRTDIPYLDATFASRVRVSVGPGVSWRRRALQWTGSFRLIPILQVRKFKVTVI
jgi:hypothetical protein